MLIPPAFLAVFPSTTKRVPLPVTVRRVPVIPTYNPPPFDAVLFSK
jgi:hypothetical protein